MELLVLVNRLTIFVFLYQQNASRRKFKLIQHQQNQVNDFGQEKSQRVNKTPLKHDKKFKISKRYIHVTSSTRVLRVNARVKRVHFADYRISDLRIKCSILRPKRFTILQPCQKILC